MNRKEKEILLRKELIIDAAEELFIESGFEKTTMDNIAEKAEYTKPTLYKYFKNREDILFAFYMRGWKRSDEQIDNELDENVVGFNQLISIAFSYCNYFENNPVYFKLLNYLQSHAVKLNEDTERKNIHREESDKFRSKIKNTIKIGIQDKSISINTDLELLVNFFHNNIYIIMFSFYNKSDLPENYIKNAINLMMKVF